jgi:hypothetical protein
MVQAGRAAEALCLASASAIVADGLRARALSKVLPELLPAARGMTSCGHW